MTKWEYKILERVGHYGEDDLDDEGAEGWELVAMTYDPMDGRSEYVFKRPLQEDVDVP